MGPESKEILRAQWGGAKRTPEPARRESHCLKVGRYEHQSKREYWIVTHLMSRNR